MHTAESSLGHLIRVHGTSSALLQRAAIVAILSFLFFMTTLLFFYIQQQLMYFILSSAFLVIYIFTMIGWVMQKRSTVTVYENGIAYRKFVATWDEIKSVTSSAASGISIVKLNGESVTIRNSVADLDQLALAIKERLP